MSTLISVSAHEEYTRITISVVDTLCDMDERKTLDQPEYHLPTTKAEPVEAPGETVMTAEPTPVELDSKPSTKAQTFKQWTPPNIIRFILHLLSIIAFCDFLILYVKTGRDKKVAEHEICREDPWSLCETRRSRSDLKAATSLSGGALGMAWLEVGMAAVTALAWHYAVWFVQGSVIVRTAFLKSDHEK